VLWATGLLPVLLLPGVVLVVLLTALPHVVAERPTYRQDADRQVVQCASAPSTRGCAPEGLRWQQAAPELETFLDWRRAELAGVATESPKGSELADETGASLWLHELAQVRDWTRTPPAVPALAPDADAALRAQLREDEANWLLAASSWYDPRARTIEREVATRVERWQAASGLRVLLSAILGLGGALLLGMAFYLLDNRLIFGRLVVRERSLQIGLSSYAWSDLRDLGLDGDRLVVETRAGRRIRSPELRESGRLDQAILAARSRIEQARSTVESGSTQLIHTLDRVRLRSAPRRPGRRAALLALGCLAVLGVQGGAMLFNAASLPDEPRPIDCVTEQHPLCSELAVPGLIGAPTASRLREWRTHQWRRAWWEHGERAPEHVPFPIGPDWRSQRDHYGRPSGVLRDAEQAWLSALAMERDWERTVENPAPARPPLTDEDRIARLVQAEIDHLAEVSGGAWIRVSERATAELAERYQAASQRMTRVTGVLGASVLATLLVFGLLFWRMQPYQVVLGPTWVRVGRRRLDLAQVSDARWEGHRVVLELRDGRRIRSRRLRGQEPGRRFVEALVDRLMDDEEHGQEQQAAQEGRRVWQAVHER